MNAFVKVSNLVRESCVVDRIDCCTAVVRCDQVSVQTARQRAFLRSHSIPFNNVVQCSCSVCALGGVRGSAVGGLFKPNKRLKHGDIHLRLGQRNDRLFAASTQQRAKVMHVQCERPVSICFHCGCKWRLAFAPEIPLPNNPPPDILQTGCTRRRAKLCCFCKQSTLRATLLPVHTCGSD